MTDLNETVNETLDLAIYLQMMGAFVPGSDFQEIKNIVNLTYDFMKNSPEYVVSEQLPALHNTLIKMSELFVTKFPLKTDIRSVAKIQNDLFKSNRDVFSYGITYGWLEELMDLSNYKLYEYVPYQFRIGLVTHKGHFGIEEEFLLRDSFNALLKAEKCHDMLLSLGKHKKIYLRMLDTKNLTLEHIKKYQT